MDLFFRIFFEIASKSNYHVGISTSFPGNYLDSWHTTARPATNRPITNHLPTPHHHPSPITQNNFQLHQSLHHSSPPKPTKTELIEHNTSGIIWISLQYIANWNSAILSAEFITCIHSNPSHSSLWPFCMPIVLCSVASLMAHQDQYCSIDCVVIPSIDHYFLVVEAAPWHFKSFLDSMTQDSQSRIHSTVYHSHIIPINK